MVLAYLRLNGVNAKKHPIFNELIRVKEHFEKIKLAESSKTKNSLKIDKAAASRFIKNALVSSMKWLQGEHTDRMFRLEVAMPLIPMGG